jgi:hypothetical protein
MKTIGSSKDFLWMAAGAAIMLAVTLVLLHMDQGQNPAAQVAFKAGRIERVQRMRLNLASASEAEKNAVMAITDEDSRKFADQSRAQVAAVELDRNELEGDLRKGGTENERNLLGQFTQAFGEFQQIDKDLLDLAVRNTNLKAYSLAFGPAAQTLSEMDAALSHLAAQDANSASPQALRIVQLADGARIAAMRIQAMLAPHIAEESDQKMTEMEARMARDDTEVHKDLDGLATLLKSASTADLETAMSRYAQYSDMRTQILKLSRENTNVLSLTLSLGRKRNVASVCQESLAALEQAIQQEPIAGVTYGTPVHPR